MLNLRDISGSYLQQAGALQSAVTIVQEQHDTPLHTYPLDCHPRSDNITVISIEAVLSIEAAAYASQDQIAQSVLGRCPIRLSLYKFTVAPSCTLLQAMQCITLSACSCQRVTASISAQTRCSSSHQGMACSFTCTTTLRFHPRGCAALYTKFFLWLGELAKPQEEASSYPAPKPLTA